jgi:hypothetical protein
LQQGPHRLEPIDGARTASADVILGVDLKKADIGRLVDDHEAMLGRPG